MVDMWRDRQSPPAGNGLVLDLCGCDYFHSGVWTNRSATGSQHDAIVPSGVEYNQTEKAFSFAAGGDVIKVPLATNPHALREATFAVWTKVGEAFANLGWLLCQYPDHGWSRALTLNDYRLGHVSVTTSQYWDSKLGQAPLGEWLHVVGVWYSDGTATVYLNGVRGAVASTNNGKSADCQGELLVIGGRAPHDPAHNAAILVADVCVFDRALRTDEVRLLHARGRTSKAMKGGSAVLAELSLNPQGGMDVKGKRGNTSATSVAVELDADENEEPVWDHATGLFWCNSGVDAYDVPEGGRWQHEFRLALEAAKPEAASRVLGRKVSDQTRLPEMRLPDGRRLARNPSDPDKRAARATHSEALKRVPRPAGVQIRLLGRTLALFRFEGRVFAVDAACPHQGANLCEGEVGDIEDIVEGTRFYVRCKVHKFQFDLITGAVIDGHCPPMRTYRARVREGTSPDGSRKASIEIGFESLSNEYFSSDAVDF